MYGFSTVKTGRDFSLVLTVETVLQTKRDNPKGNRRKSTTI
jgi:hypothetical protein